MWPPLRRHEEEEETSVFLLACVVCVRISVSRGSVLKVVAMACRIRFPRSPLLLDDVLVRASRDLLPPSLCYGGYVVVPSNFMAAADVLYRGLVAQRSVGGLTK